MPIVAWCITWIALVVIILAFLKGATKTNMPKPDKEDKDAQGSV